MEINLFISLLQVAGVVNKSQEGDLRGLTPVLMMTLFFLRNIEAPNMCQRKHQLMVINLYITLFQLIGKDKRSLVKNLRDQTPVLMMIQYFLRNIEVPNMYQITPN